MTTAINLLNVARKYIGTAQGSGTHLSLVNAYNKINPLPVGYKIKSTDDWCDMFVSVVAKEAGAQNLIGAECSVQRHIDIFKKLGIWIEDGTIIPKPGDIITYNWDDGTQPNDGWADHIGFVEKVSGNTMTLIEGNYGRKVQRRTLTIGHGNIRGYARPKYSSETSEKAEYYTEKGWYEFLVDDTLYTSNSFSKDKVSGVKLGKGSRIYADEVVKNPSGTAYRGVILKVGKSGKRYFTLNKKYVKKV